jgi:putative oxidoreductase
MNAWILLLGRVMFSVFFMMSGYNHLTKLGMMAQYAGSQGVPAPKLAVGVTGLMLVGGGLSILLGFEPRIGALLLVAFLVPTAVLMHRFWGVADPMMAQNQMIHFWKNIVMAGASLMIYYFVTLHPEPWPYSLGR